MKIALLGGSFNPLHIGHCMLAESVVKDLGYERVIFIPANIPPHKQMNQQVSAEDRFNMVKAFCESSETDGEKHFIAEDCELKRGGVSYTYDTIQDILKKYDVTGKPGLIMGQESAAQFNKWYKAQEIAVLTDFIIARRNPENDGIDKKGFENKPLGNYFNDFGGEGFEKLFKYEYKMLENPVLPVSSTEIRSRIAGGKGWRYLVPEAVFHYIYDHNLYGLKK